MPERLFFVMHVSLVNYKDERPKLSKIKYPIFVYWCLCCLNNFSALFKTSYNARELSKKQNEILILFCTTGQKCNSHAFQMFQMNLAGHKHIWEANIFVFCFKLTLGEVTWTRSNWIKCWPVWNCTKLGWSHRKFCHTVGSGMMCTDSVTLNGMRGI